MARTEFENEDRDLIHAIQGAVKTEILDVDDRAFVTREIFNPPSPAQAAALVTHTLQSVIDYITSDRKFDHVVPELATDDGLAVHVVSPVKVEIVGQIEDRFRKRETFVRAEAIEVIGRTFRFGEFYPLDQFIIALRSLFAETEDVDALIRILGRVEDSSVKQFDDDGVSQSVTATVGITTKRDVAVPALVTLIPWRTFPEIMNPASSFFLRLRKADEDEPPEAALFETDGGKWKIEAIESIREFLTGKIGEVPIIA